MYIGLNKNGSKFPLNKMVESLTDIFCKTNALFDASVINYFVSYFIFFLVLKSPKTNVPVMFSIFFILPAMQKSHQYPKDNHFSQIVALLTGKKILPPS